MPHQPFMKKDTGMGRMSPGSGTVPLCASSLTIVWNPALERFQGIAAYPVALVPYPQHQRRLPGVSLKSLWFIVIPWGFKS